MVCTGMARLAEGDGGSGQDEIWHAKLDLRPQLSNLLMVPCVLMTRVSRLLMLCALLLFVSALHFRSLPLVLVLRRILGPGMKVNADRAWLGSARLPSTRCS